MSTSDPNPAAPAGTRTSDHPDERQAKTDGNSGQDPPTYRDAANSRPHVEPLKAKIGRRFVDPTRAAVAGGPAGRDEFTAVRPGPASEPALLAEAGAVVATIAAPVRVDDLTLTVGCSIGIAITGAPVPLPVLLGRADAALARSKSTSRPVVWHPRGDADPRTRPRHRC